MSVLNDKRVLVTGASRGIGRGIARRFAAEGAQVVLCASRLGKHGDLPGSLEEAVTELQASGGTAAAIACDLSDRAQRGDLIARAEECFGSIDILVNNAAVAKMNLPSQVSCEDRSWMYEVNLNAPIDLAQQVLPGMRERHSGWILNISSSSAIQPRVPYRDSKQAAHAICAYGATKAALDRYTEGLAHEVADNGVYVNTLAPESIVLTAGAEYVRDIARRQPDMAEPLEIMVEAALELCTESHVGQVCYSRRLLHATGRPVFSLDGSEQLGDAFLPADVDAKEH
ncbi:MAG: SDR family oxidoreductase [Pseudomonadota bacterium]